MPREIPATFARCPLGTANGIVNPDLRRTWSSTPIHEFALNDLTLWTMTRRAAGPITRGRPIARGDAQRRS